jgi:glycerol kinase
MDKHIIIIDVGTQSLRSILYNKKGEILTIAQEGYSPIFNGIEVEQDPRTWKVTLQSTLTKVSHFAKENNLTVEAIAVTSQRASIIPVNKHGKYLYNAITWQDRRSYNQANAVKDRMSMQDIYLRTGLRLDSYFSAPKMMWLKENMREVYNDAYKIIGVQDYIIHLLTNRFVTDYSQAARTLLMNIKTFEWDDELIDAFNLDRSVLPEIVAPGSVVGTLSNQIVEKTGLNKDIKVIIAGGDQQCAAIGLNVLRPGTLEANTGTGSFIIGYADEPLFDENMRVVCSASAIPGKWIIEAGLLTSGNIYSWFKNEFYKDIAYDGDIYEVINREVNASGPGANGIILMPHFKGSVAPYWNPLSKGMFFNVSLENKRGDFARAILEGISYEMAENISLIENLVEYVDIINIAGGLTRFDTFNQIQADVFNKAVSVYDSSEATALGALISTLVTLGNYSDYIAAFDDIVNQDHKKTYHAIPTNVSKYIHLNRTKKHLYHALNDSHIYDYMSMK